MNIKRLLELLVALMCDGDSARAIEKFNRAAKHMWADGQYELATELRDFAAELERQQLTQSRES